MKVLILIGILLAFEGHSMMIEDKPIFVGQPLLRRSRRDDASDETVDREELGTDSTLAPEIITDIETMSRDHLPNEGLPVQEFLENVVPTKDISGEGLTGDTSAEKSEPLNATIESIKESTSNVEILSTIAAPTSSNISDSDFSLVVNEEKVNVGNMLPTEVANVTNPETNSKESIDYQGDAPNIDQDSSPDGNQMEDDVEKHNSNDGKDQEEGAGSVNDKNKDPHANVDDEHPVVMEHKCFNCTSETDSNCSKKPSKHITCQFVDISKSGCYTMFKVSENITTRGCLLGLSADSLNYCKNHTKFCSICQGNDCNHLKASSGALCMHTGSQYLGISLIIFSIIKLLKLSTIFM